MKLSELRPYVIEAHRCGLKKIPGQRMWVKKYTFYECEATFHISNEELIYSQVSIQVILNKNYDKFWKDYQEKFGAHDHQCKSLSMYINRGEKQE